jgi:glycosyltransferase involved in cell wall biosynthesis
VSATVSIIISNYFKAKYIEEAIDSVFKQTFPSYEIIIIDDTNGKDNIGGMSEPHKVYKTDDIGLSALRMYGVGKARGKYVLFLDADDKIHPTFLEKTVAKLEEHPEFSFCYTDTQHFDGADSCWLQPEYNFDALLQGNYICSCSLIRKNDLIACGGFDLDNFNYFEDYEFWIAMGAKGYYGIHIAEKLFYYRIHAESGMQSKRSALLAQTYYAYIISKFPMLYPREMKEQVDEHLSKYPEHFMKWKPFQQEEWLRQKGLL